MFSNLDKLAKYPPSVGFPLPSRGVAPPAPIWETAAFGDGERKKRKKKNWGALGAPNSFKNVTRSMRIPNMCLVLKLDNGKVVSIANEQNHRQNHANIQYRIII